jgi:hypothetical protein
VEIVIEAEFTKREPPIMTMSTSAAVAVERHAFSSPACVDLIDANEATPALSRIFCLLAAMSRNASAGW